jgi:hypothetical protein
MVSFPWILVSLLASTAIAHPQPSSSKKPTCLSDKESTSIAKKWLAIWGSNYLTKKSQLTCLVTKDISNFDGTYGVANVGIDSLFDAATYVDPLVAKVLQYPETIIHTCDEIVVRWGYSAVATGTGS